jgi:predicted DNA binding CopG/RHH family protein
MAKTKTSLGAAEGLFPPKVHEEQQVQEVQHEHEVSKEIGTTQGKKGQKLKRINMAFSDINHEYITKESRRQGISSTAFVNMIIDKYRNI